MNEKSRRIFFALWPDDDTRHEILKQCRKSGILKQPGRIMRPENLHITLHFIGNVSEQQLACCVAAASQVQAAPFDIRLDEFGHFVRAGVVWLGSTRLPQALQQLHRDLGVALRGCDYAPDPRPFKPHLTLMRNVKAIKIELLEVKPLSWSVDRFALVESIPVEGGVQYQPLQWYSVQDRLPE